MGKVVNEAAIAIIRRDAGSDSRTIGIARVNPIVVTKPLHLLVFTSDLSMLQDVEYRITETRTRVRTADTFPSSLFTAAIASNNGQPRQHAVEIRILSVGPNSTRSCRSSAEENRIKTGK